VFEHIAPEQDGEIPAVKELARVLAPHGIAILTVPFSKKYFAEYRTGRVYERISSETVPKANDGVWDMVPCTGSYFSFCSTTVRCLPEALYSLYSAEKKLKPYTMRCV
jgi:ubiquinone/menaquinone biosynthesis C-methylase UbiE